LFSTYEYIFQFYVGKGKLKRRSKRELQMEKENIFLLMNKPTWPNDYNYENELIGIFTILSEEIKSVDL
jgi:hypothetical protein